MMRAQLFTFVVFAAVLTGAAAVGLIVLLRYVVGPIVGIHH